jgi:hypothetical protein
MILNIEKLTKTIDNQYRYDISEDPLNRLFFAISTETSNFEVYRVVQVDNDDKVKVEVKDYKTFQVNAIGFSEATDYFESLLAKETSNGGNPDGENNAPPIGILEILQKSAVSVKMFDGRTAELRKGEYTLRSNIFTFEIDYSDFKKGEKYYVDVLGSNPKIMGIFPIGDLEGDSKTNQNVNQDDVDDISEGGDPFNQESSQDPNPDGKGQPNPDGDGEGDGEGEPNPDGKPKKGKGTEKGDGEGEGEGDGEGEPNPDGEGDGDGDGEGEPNPDGKKGKSGKRDGEYDPDGSGAKASSDDVASDEYGHVTEGEGTVKDPLTAKEIIAKTYGLPDYEALVDLFGGEQALLNDILSMDEMEKSGIFSKLALNYQNPSQFENTMRRIILTQ